MELTELENQLDEFFYKMYEVVENATPEDYQAALGRYKSLNADYSEFQRLRLISVRGDLPLEILFSDPDNYDTARNALAEALGTLNNDSFYDKSELLEIALNRYNGIKR